MQTLYKLGIACPRRTLVAAFALVLAVAPGALRLQLRTDGQALVPSAAAVQDDRRVRGAFGLEDQIAVLVVADDEHGIYNTRTLALIADLTAALQAIEGVDPDDVMSLATERGDRVWTGTLDFRRLLEPMPATRAELDRLRDDVRAIDLYTGTLVSRDETATAIIVGVDPDSDRPALIRRVTAAVETRRGAHRIEIVGAPVAESLLGLHLMADLGVPSALLGYRDTGAAPRGLVATLRHLVARHVGLLPVVVLLMGAVFLLCHRRPLAALLPLMEVAACLAFVFGVMGWLGVPVYLTIAVMPVILTAVGIADEVHVFSRYRALVRAGGPGDRAELVRRTLDEIWRPVVKTSLTTGIAFLSFAASPIGAVRAFGVMTAVGVVFCMVWSLTVIPACLALVSPARLVPAVETNATRTGRLSALAWSIADRGRIAVIVAAVAIAVVAPFGVARVVVQDSWIDGFAPESGFRRATRLFNSTFLGTHVLLVHVGSRDPSVRGEVASDTVNLFEIRLPSGALGDLGDLDDLDDLDDLVGQWLSLHPASDPERRIDLAPGRQTPAGRITEVSRDESGAVVIRTERGDGALRWRGLPPDVLAYEITPRRLLSPEAMDLVCALEAFVGARTEDAVGGVMGPCRLLATTSYIVAQRRDETDRAIDGDARRVLELWRNYTRVRGAHRLREVIDDRHAGAIIAVYMNDANFLATARLMDAVRRFEREHLAEAGLSVSFAGDVAVSQTLIGAIVSTQVRSLLLSLLGIAAVTALLSRSLGWGLYCTIPCGLAVLVNFALMGFVGMPLGVATSMFSAMTLGIGIDYAIHLTERYRTEAATGTPPPEATRRALVVVAPALAVDATAIALGFGVLMLSQVPANARLGTLAAVSVVSCFLATLLLLPALLLVWRPRVDVRGRASR